MLSEPLSIPRKAIGMLMKTFTMSKWSVNMSCEPASMPRGSDTVSIQPLCISMETVNMIMGTFAISREQLGVMLTCVGSL
jgi:hypothetical protein